MSADAGTVTGARAPLGPAASSIRLLEYSSDTYSILRSIRSKLEIVRVLVQ